MEPNRLNTVGNTTGKEDSEKIYDCGTYYYPVFKKQLTVLSVSWQMLLDATKNKTKKSEPVRVLKTLEELGGRQQQQKNNNGG